MAMQDDIFDVSSALDSKLEESKQFVKILERLNDALEDNNILMGLLTEDQVQEYIKIKCERVYEDGN